MKKKIPFSLEYRDKIESGEVQVVTKEGNNVRIICWDANAGDRPIVGLEAVLYGMVKGIFIYIWTEYQKESCIFQ